MDVRPPIVPESRLPAPPPVLPWDHRSLGSAEAPHRPKVAHPELNVMVVEDDPGARKYIRIVLQKAGYPVMEAATGEEALDLMDERPPRIVLLDIGLPGIDGFEVCRRMRSWREDLAILMITGRAEDADKVSSLDLGADDYLVKPFNPDVLMARIRAVARRCCRPPQPAEGLQHGDLRMEFQGMKVFKGDAEVDLTPREFSLLAVFLRHPGEILTRERLHREVWGEHHHGSSKALDVLVCKLREKLEDDPAHPSRFRTEWGVGYRFG